MSEALTLAGRCLRMNRRDPEALFMAILLPVALMLVFVYFFGGAIDTGSTYVTYVVPGLLVLCAGYGSAGTAMRVTEDMRTGVVDRFRSMGVTGTPMLAGHVAASVVRNILATAMVLSVALLSASARPPTRSPGWRRRGCCSPTWSPSPGWRPASDCWPGRRRGRAGSPSSSCSCRTRAAPSYRSRRCRPGCTDSPSTSPSPHSSSPCAPSSWTSRSVRHPGRHWPGAAASC